MNSDLTGGGIPLGFGMALAQNTKAMESFAALPESKRQSLIDGAHHVASKQEMRRYVQSICERGEDVRATPEA